MGIGGEGLGEGVRASALSPLPQGSSLLKEEAGQFRPVGHFQERVRPAVPGLGEEDGGDAVFGQLLAGFQAVFHEVLDAVVRR